MSKERVVIYSTLLALVVAGFSFYSYRQFISPALPDDVVARVVDTPITADQFENYMRQRASASNAMDIKRQLLDELIQREAQIAMARKLGYENDPDVVRALENALIARLREEQLTSGLDTVEVTDQEVTDYYQSNLARYSTPAQKRIAIIKLDLAPGASAEDVTEVTARASRIHEMALTQPSSVRGFGSLAAKYSYDQSSRYVGGDIGWYSGAAQGLDPALRAQLRELKTAGQIAPVIRGTEALYLLKLIDRREEHITPQEVVAGNVRVQLLRAKQQAAERNWIQAVVEQATPTVVNDSALSRITVSAPEQVAVARPPELPQ